MKQLEIDIKDLNLGKNNISRFIKRLSNKFNRRFVKSELKKGNYESLPNYKQRKSSVYNEY